MTNQAEHPNDTAEINEDIQKDASGAGVPKDSSAILKTPPETATSNKPDTKKAFAHDINSKIDTVESGIEQLGSLFETAEGKLKLAMGDLKSRTATITEEINEISSRLIESDREVNNKFGFVEQRLDQAVSQLSKRLGGMDERLSSHHQGIQSLQQDLLKSHTELEQRLETLRRDTQERLKALDEGQANQSRTQQVFADYLEDLKDKSNRTADELFDLNTDVSGFRRITENRFRYGAGIVAALLLAIGGTMTYLHLTQSDSGAAALEKVASLEAQLPEQYISQQEVAALESGVAAELSELEASMTAMRTETTSSVDQLSGELEGLNEAISALNLSVYGPQDEAGALPEPELTIHDQAWIDARDSGNYSIQLVGVYRESSMLNFVNRYSNQLGDHPLAYTVGDYRGQNWYNLLYGNFASFTEAQTALDELSGPMVQNAPWIREMSALQTSQP